MKWVNLEYVAKIVIRDAKQTNEYIWVNAIPSITRKTWWGGTRKTKAIPEGWEYSWSWERGEYTRYTNEQVLKNVSNSFILDNKLFINPCIKIIYVGDISSDIKYLDDLQKAKDMAIALMNNSGKKFELIFE